MLYKIIIFLIYWLIIIILGIILLNIFYVKPMARPIIPYRPPELVLLSLDEESTLPNYRVSNSYTVPIIPSAIFFSEIK
jgi:hypothetical protein